MKIYYIIIAVILIVFLIYIWNKNKIDTDYYIKLENFADNKKNEVVSNQSSNINPTTNITTKLSDRQVTFTLERPERPVEKYNNKFNEISKEKPLVKEFDDSVFSDVIYYENDDMDSPDDNNAFTGLEKCLQLCSGRCVPYAQTGNAFCFPKRSPEEALKTTYYERLLDPNDEDEKSQITNKMSYPNLR